MNRVAIAFSSKDRVDLTRRTIEPLLQPNKFDLFWNDGSKTDEGKEFFARNPMNMVGQRTEVTGGSCRAIVFALTQMLSNSNYDFVGLVENDVLLDWDWFEHTMELFSGPPDVDLEVGAVSARAYQDRVLIQRDGYAVMHNLGAGMQIFTKEAAAGILQHYRTGMTGENRRAFSIMSGIDIGAYWAFRGSEHMLVADWTWDHMLVKRGLCSLAPTPARAEQLEDIASMGLAMVEKPVAERRDDKAFKLFAERIVAARQGKLLVPKLPYDHLQDGVHIVFPHQLPQIGGSYSGDWRFKWSMGYGCFAWKSGLFVTGEDYDRPTLTVPVFGPCEFLVSGGQEGGKIRIIDSAGFSAEPDLQPEGEQGQVFQLQVPASYAYREIKLTALTPGVVFYGLRARYPQPTVPAKFDFSVLPPL